MRFISSRQVFYLLGAGVLVVVGVALWRRQPTYEGKTVQEWIWQCARSNLHAQYPFHELPTAAVERMGQRAIPLVAAELQRQSTSRDIWFRLWQRAPNWAKQRAPQRIRNRMIQVSDEPSAYEIRETAALTLGALGPQARSALPSLRAALRDPTPHVRLRAAYAVWQIDHTLSTEIVPILMELHKNPYNFKFYTALYLGDIGPAATAAIPLLRDTLTDENPNTRVNAAEALRRIQLSDKTVTDK